MYAPEIEAYLQKCGISEGDKVVLKSHKGTFEGVLLPRYEIGDGSVIVLKLDNGYNIGIRFDNGCSIDKVSSARVEFSFPKAGVRNNPDLPKVSMVYTGGTIGSKVDYVTGGVYMLKRPEELLYEVPELAGIANIEVNNLMSISSEDMTYKEWRDIADAAADALNDGAHGVVITHGTDTMHYTSAALSFMLKGLYAPVVLTGAQRSSDRGSSDGFMNLSAAFRIAAMGSIAEVGICMHETSSDTSCIMIRGTKARKMHTSRRDAFRPVNSRPIARVYSSGSVEVSQEARTGSGSPGKVSVLSAFEPMVAIVKAFPNSDPGILEHYCSLGYKGIIIEGTGLGHVPTSPSISSNSWIGEIRKAVESGVVVGVTSQCVFGRVNSMVYRNLRLLAAAGAIHCEDMTTETAYVKLGWLLGNYGAEKATGMLSVDIAGEISSRTPYLQRFD